MYFFKSKKDETSPQGDGAAIDGNNTSSKNNDDGDGVLLSLTCTNSLDRVGSSINPETNDTSTSSSATTTAAAATVHSLLSQQVDTMPGMIKDEEDGLVAMFAEIHNSTAPHIQSTYRTVLGKLAQVWKNVNASPTRQQEAERKAKNKSVIVATAATNSSFSANTADSNNHNNNPFMDEEIGIRAMFRELLPALQQGLGVATQAQQQPQEQPISDDNKKKDRNSPTNNNSMKTSDRDNSNPLTDDEIGIKAMFREVFPALEEGLGVDAATAAEEHQEKYMQLIDAVTAKLLEALAQTSQNVQEIVSPPILEGSISADEDVSMPGMFREISRQLSSTSSSAVREDDLAYQLGRLGTISEESLGRVSSDQSSSPASKKG